MAISKLKRRALPGQFLLGVDMLDNPGSNTIPLSPAFTRTHLDSGFVLGGRSPRNFYHPNTFGGIIYSAPGLTVFKWQDFSGWTLNANATAENGLTVDGLINPSSPSGGGLMKFTLLSWAWVDAGISPLARILYVQFNIKSKLSVELPQFIGYDAGLSHEGGYIDSIYTNIHDSHGDNLVNAGSIGIDSPVHPYVTPFQINTTNYDFTFVGAPTVFDLGVWINWNRPNGRWNMQAMEAVIRWS